MKTKIFPFLLAILALSACKKDDPSEEETGFDINNPEGYMIFTKYTCPDCYSSNYIYLFDFLPGKRIRTYSSYLATSEADYTVVGGNTIVTDPLGGFSYTFTFANRRITDVQNPHFTFSDTTLIQKSTVNQLAGKTFKGKYYRKDGTVLHENFWYRFAGDNKVEVSALASGITQRTESYVNVGNIAAWVKSVSGANTDSEIMVLVDGKLEVNYRDQTGGVKVYHGTFDEVK
ncbi:hypothetical protein G5B00_13490 [Parapedobacter sp. SGR-10]|uniref:hypothetical protein n=1 Tax=Parapedobacter sp. SGR-10 TaxID=2710879 RepID=UPI0013D6D569|nr:hypothetical protein [Parapedobacter sp. SGR-10]NGF57526.1 hypothetical protein [Parapedobacter sp. SGR-10]